MHIYTYIRNVILLPLEVAIILYIGSHAILHSNIRILCSQSNTIEDSTVYNLGACILGHHTNVNFIKGFDVLQCHSDGGGLFTNAVDPDGISVVITTIHRATHEVSQIQTCADINYR